MRRERFDESASGGKYLAHHHAARLLRRIMMASAKNAQRMISAS